MKRDLGVAIDLPAAVAGKGLTDKAFSDGALQRAARKLQSRSKSSQSAGPVTAFLPFTWIAGGGMLKAGYSKRGVDE